MRAPAQNTAVIGRYAHEPLAKADVRNRDPGHRRILSAKYREGTRYDYKLGFPSKLEKTIAAFANTLGGLILLGIDSDKTTNTPIWPAVTGLLSRAGLEEQVYQKATEAIYPPVRV